MVRSASVVVLLVVVVSSLNSFLTSSILIGRKRVEAFDLDFCWKCGLGGGLLLIEGGGFLGTGGGRWLKLGSAGNPGGPSEFFLLPGNDGVDSWFCSLRMSAKTSNFAVRSPSEAVT